MPSVIRITAQGKVKAATHQRIAIPRRTTSYPTVQSIVSPERGRHSAHEEMVYPCYIAVVVWDLKSVQ